MTLREVAQRAGVSPTTASFVLAGRDDMRISAEARERVRQAASDLGYRPNLTARSLRTKVTRTIALVSDTIATQQYGGAMVYGSLTAALEEEHLLFVTESQGNSEVEERLIEDLLGRQVDGFVYASMFTRQVTLPKALHGHPVVLLNCVGTGDEPLPTVLPDERAAGRAAIQVLLDQGHRDGIVVLGEVPPGVYAARERLAGMEETGVRLDSVLECSWWPEPAYEAVRHTLGRGTLPRALVCLNDRVAFGAYQALQEAGVRIPADVSVVSFDDSDLAGWLRPALTSVALPHLEMGRRAVRALLAATRGAVVDRVPMPVRDRASVGPPRAADGVARRGLG
ncbi:MAG TPA: LacI family DNA-binding transcriptional regulator [Mycobacteriales bacterium]|nr:LacI family DNA-binding transcriptional regulator [Mycobacteriales bacterium]